MALRTEQKLPIILFVVFLTLTVFGLVFYQSTSSFQEARAWQRQANEALAVTDETARLAMNVDRSVYGFALTGNDSYLEPYTRAKRVLPQNIARLKQVSVNDPEAMAEITNLETAVTELIVEADNKVEARKIGGPEEGQKIVNNVMDRPRMERVQFSVRQLKTIITSRQEARDAVLDEGLANTVWILIVSSVSGVVALGLANFIVFREIKKRQSAEVELIETNRGLEEKVEQRTEELQVMNERLMEIGGERELLLIGEKKARQEAEVANRLRDEFMATVSHELRTPLNSILGWARLLKDGSLDHSQSNRAVNTIIKNSETQNRLIEDLLDVARIISGKLELKHEPVSVLDVVSDSIETSRPAAHHKRLRIDFDHPGIGHDLFIDGDASRLRQVFSNLLTNAIKFSHEDARILVSISREEDRCIVEVVDEGVGISKEFLPLVFERFRQDLKAPGRNGGLGLGLAIVRNLVEMHGGSVNVESEGEEKGARFTVELPIIQDPSIVRTA